MFLGALDAVTAARIRHGWLVWLLPLFGLVVGTAYHRVGGRATQGTALAVSEAHQYTEGAPARMAPMVLGGTLLGHLGGASVGREGTAVQMSASLTDGVARVAHLSRDDRAALARAALAGGFGSVFGVPAAGVVFAMEVARRRTLRALVASVTAAVVGHGIVLALGHHHAALPRFALDVDAATPLRLAAAGVVFGLLARTFAVSVDALKIASRRFLGPSPLHPVVGAVATLALMLLFGRAYLGLSLPLVDAAFAGEATWRDPLLEMLFTVVALGTGFVGGEVTPLFVVGATAGAALAAPLGLPVPATAALGLVAVFGAAAHVPLTCTVVAVELVGWDAALPALGVCLVARLLAVRRSIYDHPSLTAV